MQDICNFLLPLTRLTFKISISMTGSVFYACFSLAASTAMTFSLTSSLMVFGGCVISSFRFSIIDFGLHLCTQTPHPMHKSLSTTTAFLNLLVAWVENLSSIASMGHRFTQRPHALQVSGVTSTI